MKIVDPHVHIWDLSTRIWPWLDAPRTDFSGSNAPIARSYLIEEFLAEGGGIYEIAKMVHVEAVPGDPLGESAYEQGIADRTGYPQGIVAAADLSADDVARVLEVHASRPNVRGIRQILNRHSDPLYNYTDVDYMAHPGWQKNFHLLGVFGMSFDMQLYPHQFDEAARLIAKHPDIAFIINHTGMFADRALAGWRQWRDGLCNLAKFDNVSIKISGLGMFDRKWAIESLRPYVLQTLDAFGLARCMFASNFPVDKLYSTYVALWGAFDRITSDLTPAEREGIFKTNAERVYRI